MKRNWLVLLVFSLCLWSACDDDTGDPTTCEVDDFEGVWDMNEQCGTDDFQYPLTVTKLASGIRLANLGGLGPNSYVDATVDGSAFSFAPQLVQGVIFSGNGSLNAGCSQLAINWQGGPNGSCGGTATK